MPKIRLFIVDSDSIYTMNVCRSLACLSNIEVVGTERNGTQALKRIPALHPDVLLMDVQLPGLDGISLLKEIHHMKRIPLAIFCTRFYSDISMEQAQKNGAAYFLYKPIEYHSLSSIIESCISSSRNPANHHVNPVDKKEKNISDIALVRKLLIEMGMPYGWSAAFT